MRPLEKWLYILIAAFASAAIALHLGSPLTVIDVGEEYLQERGTLPHFPTVMAACGTVIFTALFFSLIIRLVAMPFSRRKDTSAPVYVNPPSSSMENVEHAA